jgi:branched-chain amino acid aminotransferase
MSFFVEYNGKLVSAGTPLVTARNSGFRYGDGLFETMKVISGNILLSDLHFERLFRGLKLLQFDIPPHLTADYLEVRIRQLCSTNKVDKAARVRLNLFRGDGALTDHVDLQPNVLIEADTLPAGCMNFNGDGLLMSIYPEARKSCDQFSNSKVNNFLPYVLGTYYARENKLDDALLLNTYGRVCDATTSNVFLIKNDLIFTPPLSEGCIAGVMRKFLMMKMLQDGFNIQELPVDTSSVGDANEVFLTNATYGIRWVKQLNGKKYSNKITSSLYERYVRKFSSC